MLANLRAPACVDASVKFICSARLLSDDRMGGFTVTEHSHDALGLSIKAS